MENKLDFSEDVPLESISFNSSDTNYPNQNGNKLASENNGEILNKLFVGGLSYSTSEDIFKTYFEKFGPLIDFVIIRDTLTKRSRGFGFVTYSNLSTVDEVMKKRPHFIDGRKLDLKRISPKNDYNKYINEMKITKLFLPKVVEKIDENDLMLYFNRFGTILDVKIINNISQSKRFAFITFDDYDSVDKIVSLKNHEIKNFKIYADKSKPKSPMVSQNSGRFSKFKDDKLSLKCNNNHPRSLFSTQIPTYLNNNNNHNQKCITNKIYGTYHQAPSSNGNFNNKPCGYGHNRNGKNSGLFRFAPYKKN